MRATAQVFEKQIDYLIANNDLAEAESVVRQYIDGWSVLEDLSCPAKSAYFRARFLGGQVALSSGMLQLASARFLLLAQFYGQLPIDLECRLALLLGETFARLGQLSDSRQQRRHAERNLEVLFKDPINVLRLIRIRLLNGEVRSCLNEIAYCHKLLREDASNRIALYCDEGRAWDLAGDLDAATQCWLTAQDLAVASNNVLRLAEIRLLLGSADHRRGRLQDAIDSFERASQLTCGVRSVSLEAELRQIEVLIDLNQADQAIRRFKQARVDYKPYSLPDAIVGMISRVEAILTRESPADDNVEIEAYQAAQSGDFAQSLLLYETALDQGGTKEQVARLALSAGVIAIESRQLDAASTLIERALNIASRSHLPEVHWRCLQALGNLATHCGDYESARSHFEQSLVIHESQAALIRQSLHKVSYREQSAGVIPMLLNAACQQQDTTTVFHFQELQRGRLLLDLLRSSKHPTSAELDGNAELINVEKEIQDLRERILLQLDRRSPVTCETLRKKYEEKLNTRERLLDAFLCNRDRSDTAHMPMLIDLNTLQMSLPAGSVFLSPILTQGDCYLFAANCETSWMASCGPSSAIEEQAKGFRRALEEEIDQFRRTSQAGRDTIDKSLTQLGEGPLGLAILEAVKAGQRIIWAPEGSLHGIPISALLSGGKYLVETREVVQTFSAAQYLYEKRAVRRRNWGLSLIVAADETHLPLASLEATGVAAAVARNRVLTGNNATKSKIRRFLKRCRIIHFACHAEFDPLHPLSACVRTPAGEIWRSIEWLDEDIKGLPLVFLSACRSAEVTNLSTSEVFGLVSGFLGGGVRGVIAGLWPVPDHKDLLDVVWRFYFHQLVHDSASSLCFAQREALSKPNSSPLIWAVFGLFGDDRAIPATPWWLIWLRRWRQFWLHRRNFQLITANGD